MVGRISTALLPLLLSPFLSFPTSISLPTSYWSQLPVMGASSAPESLVSLSLLHASLAIFYISMCCLSANVNFLASIRQLLLYFSKNWTTLPVVASFIVSLPSSCLLFCGRPPIVCADFSPFILLLIYLRRSNCGSYRLRVALVLLRLGLALSWAVCWLCFSKRRSEVHAERSVWMVLLCFNRPFACSEPAFTYTVLPFSFGAMRTRRFLSEGLFQYSRMERLRESRERRFFLCLRIFQLLSCVCSGGIIRCYISYFITSNYYHHPHPNCPAIKEDSHE